MRQQGNRGADLIEGNDEGRLPLFQKVYRLDGLRLQSVHQVDDKDGDIAEAAATRPQIGERLVTCIPSGSPLSFQTVPNIPLSDTIALYLQVR